MQEKLDHRNAIPCEVALESIDIFKALLPDMFRYQRLRQLFVFQNLTVDAHHQYLLVIRPIEDADLASLRQALRRSPKVAVVQFFRRRRLERPDIHSQRIHPRHDVLDRTVLSSGVNALKNQKQAPTVLRRQKDRKSV